MCLKFLKKNIFNFLKILTYFIMFKKRICFLSAPLGIYILYN